MNRRNKCLVNILFALLFQIILGILPGCNYRKTSTSGWSNLSIGKGVYENAPMSLKVYDDPYGWLIQIDRWAEGMPAKQGIRKKQEFKLGVKWSTQDYQIYIPKKSVHWEDLVHSTFAVVTYDAFGETVASSDGRPIAQSIETFHSSPYTRDGGCIILTIDRVDPMLGTVAGHFEGTLQRESDKELVPTKGTFEVPVIKDWHRILFRHEKKYWLF